MSLRCFRPIERDGLSARTLTQSGFSFAQGSPPDVPVIHYDLSRPRKKSKKGRCVYCGDEAVLTADHIPPKSLFPKSVWPNLLKIPSCGTCNGGASKDDEYLRTMIGLSAKGDCDDILKPIADATARALARPQAARFRNTILENVHETFVPNSSGILVPALIGTVDLGRFDRVTARIIKGIFYAQRGKPLPSEYHVVSYSTEGLRKLPMSVGQQLRAIIVALLEREPKYIGGPQFVYWSDYNTEDQNQSTWLLVIHRYHFFIGWTVKSLAL